MLHRYKSFVNFLTLCLFCITCIQPVVYADTLTIPNTFTAGTPAQASKVNENFNAIPTVVNGNLDNANIKSGAAIAPSKLDLTVSVSPTNEWFVKRAATNRCLSAGVTGDVTPRISLYTDGSLGMGSAAADVYLAAHAPGAAKVMTSAGVPAELQGSGFSARPTFVSASTAYFAGYAAGTGGFTAFGWDGSSTVDTYIRKLNGSTTPGVLISSASTGSASDTDFACGPLHSNKAVQALTPGGRLTLTTATPVSGDVTAAGTLYYTPYLSNIYPQYNGTRWVSTTFTELSLSLASVSANTNYDVFLKGGVLSLTAWTNDTTRATALVRSATTGGLLVKNGDAQSLFLGTIRGSGAGVTAKSRAAGQLYVWNMYNRVMEDALAQDTTDSWTYTTAAYQEARAQTTEGVSRVGIVRGLDEDSVDAIDTSISANTTVGVDRRAAIGVDGTTPASTIVVIQQPVANHLLTAAPVYKGKPGLGYHTLRRLEYSTATGTTTWYGDTAGTLQSGLRVSQPM